MFVNLPKVASIPTIKGLKLYLSSKILTDHQLNFHEDPCKDARARGVNARARAFHRECAHLFGWWSTTIL